MAPERTVSMPGWHGERRSRAIAAVLAVLIAFSAFAGDRTNNDDSCDITAAPAATLLLPYFEVDINSESGTNTTTIFSITNVSPVPQIAHVTLWSDWGFPLLAFNLFLTGYDVQSIDLYDVLVRGVVAPPRGTSNVDPEISPRPDSGIDGATPLTNNTNPNMSRAARTGACASLPGTLPPSLVVALRIALTVGLFNPGGIVCGNKRVGGTHMNAIGYATIDVVNTCTARFPDDYDYLTTELLFDNVLIGDYQYTHGDPAIGNLAGGSPMVHIRAIPEGGPAGTFAGTNLPYTFYDRFTIDPRAAPGAAGRFARTVDRRQPLPAQFGVRWISGGSSAFDTDYIIWREGVTAGRQTCARVYDNATMRVGTLSSPRIVRFDERENSATNVCSYVCTYCICFIEFPPTSRFSVSSDLFPHLIGTDVAGWMYLDLNNGGSTAYSANGRTGATPFTDAAGMTITRPSQNWIVAVMSAQGRYSATFDAAWLGNGCTPAREPFERVPVGPAPNETPSGYVQRP